MRQNPQTRLLDVVSTLRAALLESQEDRATHRVLSRLVTEVERLQSTPPAQSELQDRLKDVLTALKAAIGENREERKVHRTLSRLAAEAQRLQRSRPVRKYQEDPDPYPRNILARSRKDQQAKVRI